MLYIIILKPQRAHYIIFLQLNGNYQGRKIVFKQIVLRYVMKLKDLALGHFKYGNLYL